MRAVTAFFTLLLVAHGANSHYIFDTLVYGSTVSTKAIRKPAENSPVHNYTSSEITCNINTSKATETVSVVAGTKISLVLEKGKTIYHAGPLSIYMGKAPKKAADWDGSGARWFKIAEWGPNFNPFNWTNTVGQNKFTVTIPKQIQSSEYLIRIEHIGMHIPGAPEFFISCAQIKVTGGGNGCPSKFSIPGYLTKKKGNATFIIRDIQGSNFESDQGDLLTDIFWPVPTKFTVPGPRVDPITLQAATSTEITDSFEEYDTESSSEEWLSSFDSFRTLRSFVLGTLFRSRD